MASCNTEEVDEYGLDKVLSRGNRSATETSEGHAVSEDAAPRRSIIDSDFNHRISTVVLMSNLIKFVIEVRAEDLEGTVFSSQYARLVDALWEPSADPAIDNIESGDDNIDSGAVSPDDDDVEPMEALEDWTAAPCLSFVNWHAPELPKKDPITIQDYFYPPKTFCLRLFVDDGKLSCRLVDQTNAGLEEPGRLMMQTSEFPRCPDIARIRASEIAILTAAGREGEDRFCEIPRQGPLG